MQVNGPLYSLETEKIGSRTWWLLLFALCIHSTISANSTDLYRWVQPENIIGSYDPNSGTGAESSQLVGSKIYVFGGETGPSVSNDTNIFDTDTLTWELANVTGYIPPLMAAPMIHYQNKLYVLGGYTAFFTVSTDVYYLDLDTLEWVYVPYTGSWTGISWSCWILYQVSSIECSTKLYDEVVIRN